MVRRHVRTTGLEFNVLTEYSFSFRNRCPFVKENLCSVYEERPLVCRLFPAFLEAFYDVPGFYRQPVFSIHQMKDETPCRQAIQELRDIFGNDMRSILETSGLNLLYPVILKMIQGSSVDSAYLFLNPSQPPSSPHFFQGPKGKIQGETMLNVLSSKFAKMKGVSQGTYKLSKFLKPVTSSDLRKLAKEETFQESERKAKEYVEAQLKKVGNQFGGRKLPRSS